jgi:hypothetical protein
MCHGLMKTLFYTRILPVIAATLAQDSKFATPSIEGIR